MTRNRSIERVLDHWFLDGPGEMPDRTFQAVLDRVERTPQRRLARLTERYLEMPTIGRLAAIAAAIVLAAGIGWSALGLRPGVPNAGLQPSPSPSSSVAPTAASTAGAGVDFVTISQDMRHPFLGPLRDIPELGGATVSNIDFGGGGFAWHTGIGPGGIFMRGSAVINADGELELTTSAKDAACGPQAVGRYPYRLSPGGSFLTIEPGTDDCAVRAAALPGDWLRSNCRNPNNWCLGRLEPGRYSSQYFDPYLADVEDWVPRFGALTYEVPSGWANAGDHPETYAIVTQAAYDAELPLDGMAVADGITLWAEPAAASRNECLEAPEPGIGSRPDELADWLLDHEGLIAFERAPITVDGRPARVIDIEVEPSWTETCDEANPTVAVPLFVKAGGGWHAAIASDDRQRVVVANIGDERAVVILVDSFDPETLDDLLADAMPVLETFEFADDNN